MEKTQSIKILLLLLLFTGCKSSNNPSDLPEINAADLIPTLIQMPFLIHGG